MSNGSYIELDLVEDDITFVNMETNNDTDISRQNPIYEQNKINEKYYTLPAVIKTKVYRDFYEISKDNVFELYLLAKRAKDMEEFALFAYIQEYMNDLQYITFTSPNAERMKHPNVNVYIKKLMATLNPVNKLKNVKVIGLPDHLIPHFPHTLMPVYLACKNISFVNFYVNPVDINTLELTQIRDENKTVPHLLRACK